MAKGTVKFFGEKGYGFIAPEDGSDDIFVHQNGLRDGVTIQKDDKVTFDREEGKKGFNAVNVELV